MHIFKHCREVTLFLLWIGTYRISCVVQQTSGVKDLSSLVRYEDSSLAAIRHVQSIIAVVRPRPNIRSHSVLYKITFARKKENSLFRAAIKREILTSCKVLYTKLVRVISSCFEIKMLSKNTGFSRLKCQLKGNQIYTACFQRFSKFQPTREWVNKVNVSSFLLKNCFKFVLA